jgi:CheY-like chemotaxis protein
MTRLMLALAGLAALAACSEPRNQDTGRADSIARPLEEALAESSATSTDMAGPPRSAAQERPSQGREQGPHSDVQASPAGQSMAARRLRHPAPALARAATPAPTRPPPARASAPAPAPPGPASAPIPSAGPAPDTVSPPAWVPAPDSTWASDTAGTAARWSQASAAVAGLSLPAGTTIRAALQDSINSRHDSAGQLVMARIREEITDRSGHVVVPAGSPVELSIAQLEPAKSRDASDGKLALQVDSILIDAGMDAATQARIFEPFFTTKPFGQGTGLGLAAAYGIMKQHKGHLAVTSAPGEGTAFTLYLPVFSDADVVERPEEPEPPPSGGAPTQRGATVLVVEDECAVREIATRSLQSGGFRVLQASDGAGALEMVDRYGPPHLVLTDVMMPGMGGAELARRLEERWPALPVLFMSGYSAEDLRRQGAVGFEGVMIQKPFTPEGLVRRVAAALSQVGGS